MANREIARYSFEEIEAFRISAQDLKAEMTELFAATTEFECYRVTFYTEGDQKISELADLLFVPSAGRGGIAWGAPATWTDADSAEEVIARYVNGEIVE